MASVKKYIYQNSDWPNFRYSAADLGPRIEELQFLQGKVLGILQSLGIDGIQSRVADSIVETILTTSEIEGEILEDELVRSSVASRLKLPSAGVEIKQTKVDGVVEMHLDAIQNCDRRLTKTRILNWYQQLFPPLLNGNRAVTVGRWRVSRNDPMQVVSGPIGSEIVHFEAPAADQIDYEIKQFINWFNANTSSERIIKAALAHLWFVTIHPLEDGNGRVARALTDMQLARGVDHGAYWSLSSQILLERPDYYAQLKQAQTGGLDVTEWLTWFCGCYLRSLRTAEDAVNRSLKKQQIWQSFNEINLNPRQIKMVNLLINGFNGKLTTSKWAMICKCSQDTATRDISELINFNVLKKSDSAGRSTHYLLEK